MAIVQVSKVQHRRGLQQDLPQLSSAELGWALDSRRLYIGNGTIAEGAAAEGVTEILTQYSDLLNISNNYTFKGAQSGYTSQTGVSSLQPIQRTLQLKVDDVVNVRDFGAVGDGATDDTAAIQRAIDQVYFGGFSLTQSRLRRVINMPAGLYKITDSLKLNSHVILRGEGRDRTIITQSTAGKTIFQLKDSTAAIDANYGLSVTYPPAFNIAVEQMSITHQQSTELVYLDACQDITFQGVKFQGSQSGFNTTLTTGQNGIRMVPRTVGGGILGPVKDITFVDCVFTGLSNGLTADASNIRIIGCRFTDMAHGVYVDESLSQGDTNNFKIIGSTFDAITRSAIKAIVSDTATPINITSSDNHYATVGYGPVGSTTPTYHVFDVMGTGFISLGDTFDRSDADNSRVGIAQISTDRNVLLEANVGLSLGAMTLGTGRTVVIADGSDGATSANTGVVFANVTARYAVDYLVRRGITSRQGQLTIQVEAATGSVRYMDDYSESPDDSTIYSLGVLNQYNYSSTTGTILSVKKVGSNAYTLFANTNTTSSGNVATMQFSIKALSSSSYQGTGYQIFNSVT